MKIRLRKSSDVFLSETGRFTKEEFLGSLWMYDYLEELPLFVLVEWKKRLMEVEIYLTFKQTERLTEIRKLIKEIKKVLKQEKP